MAVGSGGGASSAPPLAPWLPSTRSQPSPSQERDTFWTRQSVSHLPELGSQTTHPLFCFELLLPQGARWGEGLVPRAPIPAISCLLPASPKAGPLADCYPCPAGGPGHGEGQGRRD